MTTAPQPIDPKALKSRVRLWTTIAVSFAVLISIALFLALPKSQKPAPLPNPNGWDDFMAASQRLPNKSPDFDNPAINDLKDYLTATQEGLKLARQGLQKQTRVPTADFYDNSTQRMDELSRFKRLALALNAEGRLGQLESRPADAAKSYLDTMQFGQQCAHGGLLIHDMVAIACENIALRSLEGISADLNAQQCREVAARLEKLEASREPFEEILRAENNFASSKGVIMALLARKSADPAIQKTKTNTDKLSDRTQTLQVTLAARAYKLETGKSPEKYSDLIPTYLKSIPVNPITKKPLAFPQPTP